MDFDLSPFCHFGYVDTCSFQLLVGKCSFGGDNIAVPDI